jgi:hypothetical protein
MPSVFPQFLTPFLFFFPSVFLFLLTSQEVYDELFLLHVSTTLVYPGDCSATLALHSKVSLLLCHLYLQVKEDASWLKSY